MSNGNLQFLKGLGLMIGVNVLINILPHPFGLLSMVGIFGYFIWELYKQTRY